ncbi:MAG: CHAT domain-containing protein [Gammaproteobacteria bacterium]|nr:CHAT domain-containing protein [Gammaproteobacteria bacterium]
MDALIPLPAAIDDCQARLASGEALLQVFFDSERLRVLWLDAKKLQLRDLPDNCAPRHLWQEKAVGAVSGKLVQWARAMSDWKTRLNTEHSVAEGVFNPMPIPDAGRNTPAAQYWDQIIGSEPVQTLANIFGAWAKEGGISRLTVIFPEPLGQLPWEVLPPLEKLLVREISLAHWQREDNSAEKETLGEGGIWAVAAAENSCKGRVAQWVQPDSDCGSMYTALRHITRDRRLHLAIPARFDDLSGDFFMLPNGEKLPLWICASLKIHAELAVFSGAESDPGGERLMPAGIAPALAAAGAATVVSALWPVDDVAAACFYYHFYRLAAQEPALPWHHLLVRARHELRDTRTEDLPAIAEKLRLSDADEACKNSLAHFGNPERAGERPFAHPLFWAGFIMLGNPLR